MTDNPRQSPLAASGRRLARSPGIKFFVLGLLILLLMIPAFFVWTLVAEREQRARAVEAEIGRTWGGQQMLVGPFLLVPATVKRTTTRDGIAIEEEKAEHAVFLPDALQIDADTTAEMRSRGIYDVPVYRADVSVAGRFAPSRAAAAGDADAVLHWGDARLALGISSVSAVRGPLAARIDNADREFEPSTGVGGLAGIQVPIEAAEATSGFTFALTLVLNGSGELMVAAAGRQTAFAVQSDWPHPSFTGPYLPDASAVSAEGFSANWQVPHLARPIPQAFLIPSISIRELYQSAFGVRFFQPVDYYSLVDRALKYAVLFIGIVFLSVFVMEVRGASRVHVVQYVFVGIALVLFYVLLLSLAEHLGFLAAYLIAASATAGLVGAYCVASLASRGDGLAVFGLLAAVFAVLYLFLRLEDYALLAGSVFAFAVLAVAMFATRNVDWSGHKDAEAEGRGTGGWP